MKENKEQEAPNKMEQNSNQKENNTSNQGSIGLSNSNTRPRQIVSQPNLNLVEAVKLESDGARDKGKDDKGKKGEEQDGAILEKKEKGGEILKSERSLEHSGRCSGGEWRANSGKPNNSVIVLLACNRSGNVLQK